MATLPTDLDGVESNLIVGQNSDTTFSCTLTINGVVQPVTGTTPVMTIKLGYAEAVALTVDDSSTPSFITVNNVDDTYDVFLSYTDLVTLVGGKTYLYDIVVQNGSTQRRAQYGTIAIRPAVLI